MRYFVFVFLAGLNFLYGCTNDGYTIKGKIDGATDGMVYLKQFRNETTIAVDSTTLHNGKFTFTGKVDTPLLYLIYYSGSKLPVALFLENRDIDIVTYIDSMDKAFISGSPVTDLFIRFNSEMPFVDRNEKLRDEYRKAHIANDTATIRKLTVENKKIIEAQRKYYKEFVYKYDTTIIGAYLASRMARSLTTDELKDLTSRYSAALGDHPYVKEMKAILKKKMQYDKLSKATAIGSPAPDFMFDSKEGKKVSLLSYRGKYVLIDFWASWCKPCRRENPYSVKAYKMFRDKGFEILGISVDDDRDAWRQAIRQDQLTWPQFNDPDGVVAKQYGVHSIPSTFLLDREGIIIAKNLRGNALIKKLDSLLN